MSPIFKKGKQNDKNNYRLVNLTSVVCKHMEAIIMDHIIANIVANDLLSPFQHGFVNG